MEIAAYLESEFAMSFDEEDMIPENFDSIAAMTDFVASRVQSVAGSQEN